MRLARAGQLTAAVALGPPLFQAWARGLLADNLAQFAQIAAERTA